MPRPAILLNESSRQYRVSRLIAERQKLELSLREQEESAKIPKDAARNDDAKILDLRSELCRVLSDLIICDPHHAKGTQLVTKLKRICFLSRTEALRNKIRKYTIRIRALSKNKQIDNPESPTNFHPQVGSQKSGNQNNDVSKTIQLLSDTKKSLHAVSNEGILTLRPLCDKLQIMLLKLVKPHSESLSSTNETQAIGLSESCEKEEDFDEILPESADGIVDCISQLQIAIGDLYRYLENDKANFWYQGSARLAPGYGYAFNQLAVLSQQPVGEKNRQQQLVLAFYWYSRAVLTQQPTLLSATNVEHLFLDNRKLYDGEMSKNLSIDATNGNIFVTHFINMHYNIFLLLGPSASKLSNHDYSCVENDACSVLDRSTSKTFSMLAVLLNKQTLSDKILCKLAVIQAFTVAYKGAEKDDSVRSGTNIYYAQKSTFDFAECLAQRIISMSAKHEQKLAETTNNGPSSSPTAIPSVRLLLPFMLISEFIFLLVKQDVVDLVISRESDRFWQLFVKIANHYSQVAILFDLTNDDVDNNDDGGLSHFPDEYQALRGFKPFQPFLPPLNSDGFLTDQEAADLLDSTPSLSSDFLTPQSACSKDPCLATRATQAKIKRFLTLSRQVAACSEINVTMNTTNGTCIWKFGQEENLEEHDNLSITLNPSSDTMDEIADAIFDRDRQENPSSPVDLTEYKGMFDNAFNYHEENGDECHDKNVASNCYTSAFDPVEIDHACVNIEILTDRPASEIVAGTDHIQPTDTNQGDPSLRCVSVPTYQENEIEGSGCIVNMGDITDTNGDFICHTVNENRVVDAFAEGGARHRTDSQSRKSPSHASTNQMETKEETAILSMPSVKESLSTATVGTESEAKTGVGSTQEQQQDLKKDEDIRLSPTGSHSTISTLYPIQEGVMSNLKQNPKRTMTLCQEPAFLRTTQTGVVGGLEPELFSWHPQKRKRLLSILEDPDTFGGPQAYRTRNPFANPIFHSDGLTKEQIIAARGPSQYRIIVNDPRPRWDPLFDVKPDFWNYKCEPSLIDDPVLLRAALGIPRPRDDDPKQHLTRNPFAYH